jgi:ribosomal-protein-alanine N-acetyltransferase
MEINIREYNPDDEIEVFNINKKTLEISFKSLYNIFHKKHSDLFLVAEDSESNKIIGFILVTITRKFEQKDSGLVYAIAIHPNYQSQGIGKKLINNLVDNLTTRHIDSLYLHVKESNYKAITFYSNLGFEKIELIKKFYTWGEGAFRMKLDIHLHN